jgi:predicted amidohydrolase YtcJ
MRTLYRATTVRTLSHPRSGEWLLVDGRHVERVGTGDPPRADRIVDLPGATIFPGFVDAHVHLTGTGVHHRAPGIAEARSRRELLDRTRAAAAESSGPVLLHGFDESRWAERDPPTIEDLDTVSDRPLALVRVDGHVTHVNGRAIAEVGLGSEEGVERDARGAPTGRLTGAANDKVQRWFHTNLDARDVEQLQLAAASLAVACGVTCVHEMSIVRERGVRDLEVLLAHRDRLPLDVVVYPATTDIPQVMDLGLPRIGGDLPVDGSIGARTAHVSHAFVDRGELGATYLADDELVEFLHAGHLAGLQVGVHAIGDAAIDRVVTAWERVYISLDSRARRHFRARRHRIEHFEMPSADAVERAAALGLAIGVQPSFDASWGFPGGLYEQALGAERARTMNPFRSLLERGLELGAGSDSPITTIEPFAGVAAFEQHHDPTQRLSREEALRLFTLGGARLAHLESKKGSLEPGKHADLAAYEVDPIDAVELEKVRPILTVSLGREVFSA